MIAFKAFNKDLTAKLGDSTKEPFQFEAGKTYKEESCKCAKNGFHCAENPLCCLTYYSADARFFIVDAAGDINQDGTGSRISCTEITLLKEISLLQMGLYGVQYIEEHPKRKLESNYAVRNSGECEKDFLIVRGKEPQAKGKNDAVIFFLEEDAEGNIDNVCPIQVGEDGYKEDKLYYMKGGIIYEK